VTLLDDIPEGSLVALDTMVWIYEFEAHPVFGPIVHPFFRDRLDAGKNRAGSSLLTLGELLVQPLASGRADIAVKPNVRLEVSIELFREGAVTLNRAAEIAGLNRWQFHDLLIERGVKIEVEADSAADLSAAAKAIRDRVK